MLASNDIVDLVAPASALKQEEYKSCLKFIEDLGLKPRARDFESLVDAKEGFCSNSADYRFENLMQALSAEDSAAVWCLTGGYGSYQLLEKLSKAQKPAKQKLFIGFSDITILLNFFANNWGWNCLHGPMLKQLAQGEVSKETTELVKKIIFGETKNLEIELTPLNKTASKAKQVSGELMGGCLSLMQVFIGTPQEINMEGKILLLEDDRFETPARISRILDHMLRAGIFDKLKAVIFGGFLEDETEIQNNKDLQVVFSDIANKLEQKGVPLVLANKLGHGSDMIPLTLGKEIILKTGDKPKMNVEFNI